MGECRDAAQLWVVRPSLALLAAAPFAQMLTADNLFERKPFIVTARVFRIHR